MAKTDIEIAREANMLPIGQIGDQLSIPAEALLPYGFSPAWEKATYSKLRLADD